MVNAFEMTEFESSSVESLCNNPPSRVLSVLTMVATHDAIRAMNFRSLGSFGNRYWPSESRQRVDGYWCIDSVLATHQSYEASEDNMPALGAP
jgi:hypothetical protein